jgi:hypothetical protein
MEAAAAGRIRVGRVWQRAVAALALGWALLAAGCAPFAPQRIGVGPADVCALPQDPAHPAQVCKEASIERAPNFDIAFVEMTDQGWMHLRAQWDRALELIDHNGSQVQVILFVHGWRHSASFDDLDVRHFREVVLPAFAAAHPERRTVGLYIGWRAQSIDAEWFGRLSFWDRKATAERIARGSIRELIGRLRHQQQRTQQRVHVSLIGHSFGGLIVFNAIAESLLDALIAAPAGEAPQPVVDMALVLNPAFEASRFEPLFQVARRLPPEPPDRQPRSRPIFVSITSEDDTATREVFPIGRLLNAIFGRKRWTDEDDCPGGRTRDGDCPGGDPDTMLERVTNANTIGHLDRYLTHRLRETGDGTLRCVREPGGPAAGRAFPLWTIRTDASVMADHHDIYRPALWRFIVGLAGGASC